MHRLKTGTVKDSQEFAIRACRRALFALRWDSNNHSLRFVFGIGERASLRERLSCLYFVPPLGRDDIFLQFIATFLRYHTTPIGFVEHVCKSCSECKLRTS
jgi:hypothetical protein